MAEMVAGPEMSGIASGKMATSLTVPWWPWDSTAFSAVSAFRSCLLPKIILDRDKKQENATGHAECRNGNTENVQTVCPEA